MFDDFSDVPGFFFSPARESDGGVIVIHADWPAYSDGPGIHRALAWMTMFPRGTRFFPISDIDRCLLFVVEPPDAKSPLADPAHPNGLNADRRLFDPSRFHVAVWHQDVRRMWTDGLIDGRVQLGTRYDWEMAKYDALLSAAGLPPGTESIPLRLESGRTFEWGPPGPDRETYEEEHGDEEGWPLVRTPITVSDAGWRTSQRLLSEPVDLINDDRLRRILSVELFDTAVREACVDLEHRMKSFLGTDAFGRVLVEEFVKEMSSKARVPEPGNSFFERQDFFLVFLRARLRGTMQFIRNEFMHNRVELDRVSCLATLVQVLSVRDAVDGVITDRPLLRP